MSATIIPAFSVAGDGPPLFLIHGIGAARDVWRFMIPPLSEHFTVISFDLRGHGESPAVDAVFELDALVEDLEALREQTGFARAHFAGHSLGGMIAPAYARRYPEKVLSLGLLSTAAFRNADDRVRLRTLVHTMAEDGISSSLPLLAGRWFTDAFAAARRDIVEARLRQVQATDTAIFLNVFRIYAETEMSPWLNEVQAPALVVTGEYDGGCSPRLGRQITAALPDAQLIVLPGYKHAILLEAPQEVAGHLIRFMLRSLSA